MRYRVFLSGTLLGTALLCPAAAAGPPATPDFATLVKRGDSARVAGDLLATVEAYRAALELRDDPLVAGRLGLVLLTLNAVDAAAGHLLHAVEYGAGSSDAERQRFWSAYQVAQREVCRINISIDQKNAILAVDGESRPTNKGDFWLFLTHGKHTLRVSREGFEDETKEITAERGGKMDVVFSMRPVPKPAAIAVSSEPSLPDPPPLPIDKPAPKTNPRTTGQFVFGIGTALVLGTTPGPALGPHLFAAWRSRSWWEVGVDLRAAWTFVPDPAFPATQFVTWSTIVAPCARPSERWFACALMQFDGVARDDTSRVTVLPGFGVRGGVQITEYERFRLQVWADVAVHPATFRFQRNIEWNGSLVTGAFGLRGIYGF